jgi:hypothetical protein
MTMQPGSRMKRKVPARSHALPSASSGAGNRRAGERQSCGVPGRSRLSSFCC